MSDDPHSPLPIQNTPPPIPHTSMKNVHLPPPNSSHWKKMSTHSHLYKIYLHLPNHWQKIPPSTHTRPKRTYTHHSTSNRKCSITSTHSKYTFTYLQQPVEPKIYLHQPQPTHNKCSPTLTYPKHTSTYHHLTNGGLFMFLFFPENITELRLSCF